MIIGEIGSKGCSKRFLVDREDVIEAFSADRSNQALDIGALPGGSRSNKDFMNPHVFQLPFNVRAIDTSSVPDNVLRSGVIRESVTKLLRSPFSGWMRRYVEVNDVATLMRENQENIENAEENCRNGEKINRGKLLGVVFQKCAPWLRWRFGMSDHVFSDSCLRDSDSEFEQFAMNSRGSPEGIIFVHGADEITNIFRNPRSSCLAVPAFPGPKHAESLAMSGNDGFRFNNDESRAPLRPEP